MAVKTHSFRLGKYHFDWLDTMLEGMCELPDDCTKLYMMIPEENTCKALCTCIHEMMHAEGIPNKYLDGEYADAAERIGKCLWRIGWRRK